MLGRTIALLIKSAQSFCNVLFLPNDARLSLTTIVFTVSRLEALFRLLHTRVVATCICGRRSVRSGKGSKAADVRWTHARLAAALSPFPLFPLRLKKTYLLCVPVCQESLHKDAMTGIVVESVGSMRPKGKSYDINVFQVCNLCPQSGCQFSPELSSHVSSNY